MGAFNQSSAGLLTRRLSILNRPGFSRTFELQTQAPSRCRDTAVAESSLQPLKRERICRQVYAARNDARADVFNYIKMFYSPKRRHGNV